MPHTVADENATVQEKSLLSDSEKNGKTDHIEFRCMEKEKQFVEGNTTGSFSKCGCQVLSACRTRERIILVVGMSLVLFGLVLIVIGLTTITSKSRCPSPQQIHFNNGSTLTKENTPTTHTTESPQRKTTMTSAVTSTSIIEQSDVTLIPNADPRNPTVYRNLALGMRTNQSSSHVDDSGFIYNSSLAVDGIQDTRVAAKSCSRTDLEIEPHWTVDLGRNIPIKTVHIIRPIDCCRDELYGFEIRVSQQADFRNTILCKHYMGLARGTLLTIPCDGNAVYGRHVRITHLGDQDTGEKSKNRLTLCEVLVFPI